MTAAVIIISVLIPVLTVFASSGVSQAHNAVARIVMLLVLSDAVAAGIQFGWLIGILVGIGVWVVSLLVGIGVMTMKRQNGAKKVSDSREEVH